MSRLTRVLLAALAAGGFVAPITAAAQSSGPGTGGAVAHARSLVAQGNWKRVLMIGAHPDDEYTDLIALLARGQGIETAYLSLTRGEGGQNLIGNELGVALGLLRTEELLAARRVDGGRQFFTRAFDFGFSKTAEETFRFWPRDELLEDVVRVIRTFRPQVIVSVWSGTPRDGHGQHTVAGIVAREAFEAAGESGRFPRLDAEGLGPWRAAKFYLAPYTLSPDASMLVLDGGAIEPASGLSMHQLAARSRSQHRSQDMGSLEEPGPWPVRVSLAALASGIRAAPSDPLFAGIAADAPAGARFDSVTSVLRLERHKIVLDAYADDDEIATGNSATVTLLAWNAGDDTVSVQMTLPASGPWFVENGLGSCGDRAPLPPRAKRSCQVVVTNQDQSQQPYFLHAPLDGNMYRWTGTPRGWGLPFVTDPSPTFHVTFRDGSEVNQSVEIRGRFVDQAIGEVRRAMVRVPRIALDMQPSRVLWRQGERSRVVQVHVEHLARDTTRATVALEVPTGWIVSTPRTITLSRENERTTVEFNVAAPVAPTRGEVIFRAAAIVGSDTLRQAIHRIGYSHVTRRVYFTPSETAVVVAPVVFARGVRAGYVRGAADLIPEALADAGVALRILDDASLDSHALDSLDVLAIGPRAYEVSEAVRRANPRIIEWVRGGGTLIVQYQQYQYIRGDYAPRPFTISRPHDRVTDETAAVMILDPAHPLFRYPNIIGADDFTGWIQERGLYFAGTWDNAWTPLLEMHDPGEGAQRGSLLVAPLGRGRVVYTGLAFFRQIPTAVPGAWRLFANLLALGETRGR